ncbi:FAD dependent oxidoreductase [Niveomyces insectorum RCEF 264]|uniref:FAD dependent oxidoreductase n=1 Tax=Niveomyces insectorum RCEF 264 TaxID=1081102 RepID=A0A167NPA0_9HYPO|nr:FAD dependent oxidoreductase [Niveomyces insectorum RCEF 264]
MGSFVSALVGSAKLVKIALGALYEQYLQFRELDARINQPPGLPRPSPTRSFWLEDPPYPELVDIQSAELPVQADVVIIGSGITGVAVAWSLLAEHAEKTEEKTSMSPPPRVVVLEARQLCSGATGRNGGHIKASPHETMAMLVHKFHVPAARAAALVRFQLAHLDHLLGLCAAEPGLQAVAECREVETVDLFVDAARFREGQEGVALVKQWVPEFPMHIWTASEAQEAMGPHVVGAISYRAGALWPYRLVTSLWKRLLEAHPHALFLETSTPVEAVEVGPPGQNGHNIQKGDDGDAAFPYRIVTPRGVVHARHVVHATNAFTSQFLPQLRRKTTGLRAHMSAQRPGAHFPDLNGQRSWSIIIGAGFDYITQRPTVTTTDTSGHTQRRPGMVMAGGGFTRSANQGLDQFAVYDDTDLDLLTATHLHGMLPATFAPFWGPDDGAGGSLERGQGHVESMWTGIVAVTGDTLPLVGRLDDPLTERPPPTSSSSSARRHRRVRPLEDSGEWISASYAGDGMVWAWLCGTAVGLMVAGRDQEALPPRPGRPAGRVCDWLPPELLATHDRLRKIDVSDLSALF